MQTHIFHVEDAERYGVDKAVLLYHFRFWVEKNMAHKRNYHDGRTWTYMSATGMEKLFPYWGAQKIARLLRQLVEDDGVLVAGNYNATTYDRTKWYAFTDEKCIVQNLKMDDYELNDGSLKSEQPIPDINTDSKPDKKTQKSKVKNGPVENPPKEKIEYAETVTMARDEHAKLVERYGKRNTDKAIDKLNNWKLSKGYGKGKYKSDYRAILTWVMDAIEAYEIHKKPSDRPETEAEKVAKLLQGKGASHGIKGIPGTT